MKRIVDGVTYNTDTSTLLALAEWDEHGEKNRGTLYQTRGGAFFVHHRLEKEVWNQRMREREQRVEETFEPMSPDDAHKWLLEGEVEIFNNPFDDPPEATAEAEPGATIYIRVPASLKKRVDDAAQSEKVSGNQWAMRCVERCLEKDDTFKWWEWIEEAFEIDDRTPVMFAVMAWVVAHASTDGSGVMFDGDTSSTIAEEIGATKPAVRAAVDLLIASKFLLSVSGDRGMQRVSAVLPSVGLKLEKLLPGLDHPAGQKNLSYCKWEAFDGAHRVIVAVAFAGVDESRARRQMESRRQEIEAKARAKYKSGQTRIVIEEGE